MTTTKKVALSGGISTFFIGLWLTIEYTNQQLLLNSAVIQIVIWLIIGTIQAGFVMHTPKYWKVVPIIGTVAAFVLAVLFWVTAELVG